jgi:hypothetical protein
MSRSVRFYGLSTVAVLRLGFGHQQSKKDKSPESDHCQGDKTDGVIEDLYYKDPRLNSSFILYPVFGKADCGQVLTYTGRAAVHVGYCR